MAQRGEVSCPRSHSLSISGPEMNPWFPDLHPQHRSFLELCPHSVKESGFAGLAPPALGQSPCSPENGGVGVPAERGWAELPACSHPAWVRGRPWAAAASPGAGPRASVSPPRPPSASLAAAAPRWVRCQRG